jgi:hypothetical protein
MTCQPFEPRCFDGRDDDCDGRIDCADPDCVFDPSCCMPSPEICDNFVDDDCDFAIDCEDPSCSGDPACCFPTPELCTNGVDDDCDGLFDCADPDCAAHPSCGMMCTSAELGVAMCTDRLDNDCDTRRDCNDPDCRPFGPGSECCNGVDDDGDGTVDLFTCRCFNNSTCLGVGTFEQVCWTALFNVCAPRCDFLGGDSFCDLVAPGLRCVRRGPQAGQCVPDGVPPPPPMDGGTPVPGGADAGL